MKKIYQLSIDDLENLIEQKILEFIGDPDVNLDLREDFKKELKARLSKRAKQIPQSEVMKRFD